jgi:hypothetical protein
MISTNTVRKWTKPKSPKDIPLQGIRIDTEWIDSALSDVLVYDDEGHVVRITKGDYNSIQILVPA